MSKVTPETLKLMKRKGEKISSITAYDYSTARIVDEAGIDFILVGDSAAMVMLGYPTTHGISVDEIALFTGAVARGAKNALIVADMPFGSYQASIEEGVKNACELIKCGANAVTILPIRSLISFISIPQSKNASLQIISLGEYL